MGAWYYDAPDGRRWHFNKEPSFECPNYFAKYELTDPETGEKRLVAAPPDKALGITFRRHVPEEVERAAELIGCGGEELAAMLLRSHQSVGFGRKRVDGRLTNTCRACGGKMKRLGFYAYADEPIPEGEETAEQRSSAAINQRLVGGDGRARRTTWSGHFDTKREARQWAYENMVTAEAAWREQQETAKAGEGSA